jgi:hypothetical protein
MDGFFNAFQALDARMKLLLVLAPDGNVYALAQGELILVGYSAGSSGTSVTVNHPTVGTHSKRRDSRKRSYGGDSSKH